jgi:hypothetical protein
VSTAERSDSVVLRSPQMSVSAPSQQPVVAICRAADAITTQRIASASVGNLPKTPPTQNASLQADRAPQIDNGLQRSYSADAKPGNDSSTPPMPMYSARPAASPGRCPPISPSSVATPRSVMLATVTESDVAQSPLSVRLVEARCPQGHALAPYICPPCDAITSFKCDNCLHSQVSGTTVYGCRGCNYDLCSACMKQACASSPSQSLVGSQSLMTQTAQACQNWLTSQPQASLLVASQTRPATSGYPQRSVAAIYTSSSGANPNEAPANAARMRISGAVVTPVKQRPEDVGRVVSYGSARYAQPIAGAAYAHHSAASLQRPPA